LELLRFKAESYVGLTRGLFDLEVCISLDGKESLTEERKAHALDILKACLGPCKALDLAVTLKHIEDLEWAVRGGDVHQRDIANLIGSLRRELSTRYLVEIAPERVSLYTSSLTSSDWPAILKRFPAASDDVEEMGKCFALCRYSAAVFHSLLVAEHGLVRLGVALGVTDPKEGWDASTRKLEAIVKAGHNANQTGLDFAFLEQTNAAAQAMKHAWRNKVNHATGKPMVMAGGFASYVAEEIVAATRAFMRRLSDGLPEVA
jgi:hypothetical protein